MMLTVRGVLELHTSTRASCALVVAGRYCCHTGHVPCNQLALVRCFGAASAVSISIFDRNLTTGRLQNMVMWRVMYGCMAVWLVRFQVLYSLVWVGEFPRFCLGVASSAGTVRDSVLWQHGVPVTQL